MNKMHILSGIGFVHSTISAASVATVDEGVTTGRVIGIAMPICPLVKFKHKYV
jgi:hypothetical protein